MMSPLQSGIFAKATPTNAAMYAEDWCRREGWASATSPNDQFGEGRLSPAGKNCPARNRMSGSNYHNDAEAAWLHYGRPGSYKVPSPTSWTMEPASIFSNSRRQDSPTVASIVATGKAGHRRLRQPLINAGPATRPHPQTKEVYSDRADADLIESVRSKGHSTPS